MMSDFLKAVSTGFLSSPQFEVVCGQGEAARPKGMYILNRLWQFAPSDPHFDTKMNEQLRFTMDLSGWRVTSRTWGFDFNDADEMVMFLALKSNNDNSVRLYIDGDQFVIGSTNTDTDETKWASFVPERMATTHDWSLDVVLTKPGREDGLLKIKHNGVEVFRHRAPLVRAFETGTACYWMLGLDCRAGNWPEKVTYRRAVFHLGEAQGPE